MFAHFWAILAMVGPPTYLHQTPLPLFTHSSERGPGGLRTRGSGGKKSRLKSIQPAYPAPMHAIFMMTAVVGFSYSRGVRGIRC